MGMAAWERDACLGRWRGSSMKQVCGVSGGVWAQEQGGAASGGGAARALRRCRRG